LLLLWGWGILQLLPFDEKADWKLASRSRHQLLFLRIIHGKRKRITSAVRWPITACGVNTEQRSDRLGFPRNIPNDYGDHNAENMMVL